MEKHQKGEICLSISSSVSIILETIESYFGMAGIEGAGLFDYEYCALFSGNMLFLWQDGVVNVDLESDGKSSLPMTPCI